MSKITPNQMTILEALQDGPRWARSFQTVKPLVDDLIACDLIERCRPRLGRGRNMLRLTVRGCDLLELDYVGVPTEQPKGEALHATKRWDLGVICDGATPLIRRTCEIVVSSIKSGASVPDAVGFVAEAEGVQRPAVWRRLRAGGIIRPIRTGVRTVRRTIRQIEDHREPVAIRVDRDPCPRCGVRGDIGCTHSRAPIGTSF